MSQDIKAAIEELRREECRLQFKLQETQNKICALQDKCQHVPGPGEVCTVCRRWL